MWQVAVDGAQTTAVFEPATSGKSAAVFVAGHGAGSHRDHRSMVQLAQVLRGCGFGVVRFNFLYREQGSGVPDRMPRLQACFSSVTERVRQELPNSKLIIGGRSMGGRVASMLAAEGFECDGLLLFAYPLHPAGQREKLRAAHLPQIKVPVLCINGTRDALCDRILMERAIANLSWQMHWLEGKDHSFQVTAEVGEVAGRWLAEINGVR